MHATGDKWQEKFWGALSGTHIDPTAMRMLALKACKGPGKSFAMGVGGWWWLFTRWHTRGAALSITGDNLKDNLWTEMAHLQEGAPILGAFFEHKGERIECKQFRKTWWLSARSFPQNADKTQQANTLAGLHCRHPQVLCDEAGDYPDGVIVAAEAVLSSLVDGQPPDGRVVLAGNPTNVNGPLYRVTTKDRKRWWVYEITSNPADPDRTPRVDPVWAQEQIDLWGIDSDFVKVNILGMFPAQSVSQLLGPEQVMAAVDRHVDENHRLEPIIFGMDVARDGQNASTLYERQGYRAWLHRKWRDIDHMTLADLVASEYMAKNPAAFFIDHSPVSAGLIDRLRDLRVPVVPIDFGGAAIDSRFYDRRSEMWWKMANWVKSYGSIPNDIALRSDLLAPTISYKPTGKITKMKMESKDEMKKRGVASTDDGDGLGLTFAASVVGHTIASIGIPSRSTLDHLGLSSNPQEISQIPVLYVQSNSQSSGRIRGGTEDSWDPYGGGQ